MARTYKRDARGRFSSSGGGGGGGGKKSGSTPGSKAASTRAANLARAAQLKAAGTTAIGARVKAKGFSGGKGAQKRAGGLRAASSVSGSARAFTVGRGGKMSSAQRSATQGAIKRTQAATSRAAQKGAKPARTNKAPVSAAKARYKELSGRSRRSGPLRTAADNRSAAGARRSLNSMVQNRGAKPATKKRPILDAIARPILRAMDGGKRGRR